MLDELKKQFTSVQILITLLIVAVGIYIFQVAWQVLGQFSDIFVLLISSWLISFILEPAVENTTRITKFPKVISALTVYLVLLGLVTVVVFLFVPIVSLQYIGLTKILTKYFASYPGIINKWGDLVNSSLTNSLAYIPSVANFFFSFFIVLIISFYFIIDKQRINTELMNFIPQKWHKDTRSIQQLIDNTFASFLRVQLLFGVLAGVTTWLVLILFHIEFAASTAVLAGIFALVPLLGPVLSIIPPILVVLITTPGQALVIFIALLIVQQIIYNVLGPKILGNVFKLHPVVVLLSFIIGYKLAGPAGAIFAVPVLGILFVLIHRLSHYFIHPAE